MALPIAARSFTTPDAVSTCTTSTALKRRLPALVRWDLLLIAVAPMILYGLVVVHARYLGAFVVLFGLALLPAVRLPAQKTGKAMAVWATLGILLLPATGLARAGSRDLLRRSAGDVDWDTATGLRAMGLHPGDRVGCIGLSWDVGWARLARVSVVAQILSNNVGEYWDASPRVRAAALRAFARAGARAVVTGRPPAGSAASGWRRLGATDRYVRLLHPPTQSSFARVGTRLLASPPTR